MLKLCFLEGDIESPTIVKAWILCQLLLLDKMLPKTDLHLISRIEIMPQ